MRKWSEKVERDNIMRSGERKYFEKIERMRKWREAEIIVV